MHWEKVAVAATENTGQKPENCTHGRENLELAHSSHVSTFPARPGACREVEHALVSQPRAQTTGKAWKKAWNCASSKPRTSAEPAGKGTARNCPARMEEFGNAELRAEANPCLECKPQELQPRHTWSTFRISSLTLKAAFFVNAFY